MWIIIHTIKNKPDGFENRLVEGTISNEKSRKISLCLKAKQVSERSNWVENFQIEELKVALKIV